MRNDKGIVVAIEGPSGVGKDTVIKGLINTYPNMFKKVPSTTTREMRVGESQGDPYFFVDEPTFKKMIESGEVFEHTIRHGQYRGMSLNHFDNIISQGIIPLKDCDKVGLDALRGVYGDRVFSIFITCPKEEIEKRLIGRGDSGEDLKTRLNNFDEYIKNQVYFDTVVENIDLSKAVADVYNKIMDFYESLS